MRDAAGAEEGGPVGVVGGFGNGVIGPILEGDAGEPPGAGGGIGIQLATGEGDATELRAGDDTTGIEVERRGLCCIRAESKRSVAKARYIISEAQSA